MARKHLTARQQEIFDFVKNHISTTGMPPTRVEIAREIGFKSPNAAEEHLKALVMKTSRLSFTACNEFIGWDFVRENANSQEFLKHLSDQLEALLLAAYLQLDNFKNNPARREGLAFLLKASKSIVFSFAFTSVSDSDVRKNFVSFQKEILPFLVKAAL